MKNEIKCKEENKGCFFFKNGCPLKKIVAIVKDKIKKKG